jgi:hypothetical protein
VTAAIRFIFGAATEALASLAPATGKPAGSPANQPATAPDAFASLLAAVLAPSAPATPLISEEPLSAMAAVPAAAANADAQPEGVGGGTTALVPAQLDLRAVSGAWKAGTNEVERLFTSGTSMPGIVPSAQQETELRRDDQVEGAATGAGAPSAALLPAAAEPSQAEPVSGSAAAIPAVPMSAAPALVLAPTSGDPRRVNRTLEGLNPEFRTRLERVISRMSTEHGHRVNVVETVRDQARQDHLFEQGRTRPGPVVTWTRASQHSEGRAADVQIDGTYDNAAGYAKLARIAAEEGLRTLGARDPGHVELPGNGARSLPHIVSASSEPLPRPATRMESQVVRGTRVAQPAQVAPVAQVASVAQVAAVAQVASPATPGTARAVSPGFGRSNERPERTSQAAPAATLAASISASDARPVLTVEGTGERAGTEMRRHSTVEPTPQHASNAESGLGGYSSGAFASSTPSSAPVEALAPGSGTDAAARLGQILEMQEGGAARPLSHVLLRMEAPGGGEERIRVDLRGTSVGTIIDVTDANAAERLHARVGELQHALEGKGLEAESVQIRSATTKPVEGSDAARTLAGAAEGEVIRSSTPSRSGSDSTPHRERGETARDQSQSGSRDPRNRSRQERKGDTPQ